MEGQGADPVKVGAQRVLGGPGLPERLLIVQKGYTSLYLGYTRR